MIIFLGQIVDYLEFNFKCVLNQEAFSTFHCVEAFHIYALIIKQGRRYGYIACMEFKSTKEAAWTTLSNVFSSFTLILK